ncbi:MAG TPA: hypothetical protein VKD26_13085 [Streptosporangiaceae bacterium]|nr:hypothetical protein [Streptosporangiaceae bacterium]
MGRRRHRNKFRDSRAGRLRRSLGLDRNPLRRTIDRVEALVRCALLAVFLACGPLVAAYVGHRVESAAQFAGRTQAALHRVTARVLKELPGQAACGHGPCQEATVLARWTGPSGLTRTGTVTVTGGVYVGATLAVWLNGNGQLVDPPASHGWVIGEAASAAAGALCAVGLACFLGAVAAERALSRRKLAGWEADWLVVGPRWTKRH